MKSFAIIIQSHPNSDDAKHALQFCNALLASKHSVLGIFFHAEGVKHCQETFTLSSVWQECAETHDCKLSFCLAALDEHNLYLPKSTHFHASSLAPFIANIVSSADRLIQFSDCHD